MSNTLRINYFVHVFKKELAVYIVFDSVFYLLACFVLGRVWTLFIWRQMIFNTKKRIFLLELKTRSQKSLNVSPGPYYDLVKGQGRMYFRQKLQGVGVKNHVSNANVSMICITHNFSTLTSKTPRIQILKCFFM